MKLSVVNHIARFLKISREKESVSFLLLFFLITIVFFSKMFFFGLIPFPGDIIVGEYAPYSSYSFLGYAPGSFTNKGQNFDVAELLYPAKHFSIESFKNLEIPLWNPYNFSGNPHLASLQSGSLYPLNLIFLIQPFIYAWSFYIYLQPFLAGFFTFLLLREFRLGFKSSLFGALSFAFSSYFVVWMEYGNIGHSIVWLPLLMLFSLKFVRKPSLILFFSMVIGLTFSLLAGYIQTSFYVFVFLFVFTSFNIFISGKEKRLNKLLITIPVFILPLLLSSVQMIPTLELLISSSRTSYSPSSFIDLLIPKVHLATLFAPDFFGNPATRNYWLNGTYIERVSYIGLLPLIFAAYAVLKRQNLTVWFFTLSSFIALLLSFDTLLSRFFYSLNLPLISNSVPTRIMFVFCFSASILAAFGFEHFEKLKKKDDYLLISLLIIGAVFIILWIFVFGSQTLFQDQTWIKNLAISKRNLILPTVIFGLSLILMLIRHNFSRFKKHVLIVLILLTVFDLYYFFQKITPFSPIQSVYPKTDVLTKLKSIQGIDRSWGYGSGYMESNIQTFEKIYTADGYDALHIKRYGELVSSSANGKIPEIIPRSEAEIVRGFGSSDLRNNANRQRILNLLGVKYIIHKVSLDNDTNPDYQTFNDSIYQLAWDKGKWQIYENKDSLPRISLFGDYIVENDRNKIIHKIYDPAFNLKKTLILEERLPGDFITGEDKDSDLKILEYSPNKIIAETYSTENSLLFVSDSYFPGWKVTIDREEGKIYRADFAFRAVPVSKGNHEVVFSYSSNSFNLGLKISALTFILILLIAFLIKIKSYART